MATSASTDFQITRLQLINDALRLCGALPGGQTAANDQADEAARALNVMVKSWEAEHIHLWAIERTTQALVDGTASYTLAIDTLDVVVEGDAGTVGFIRRAGADTPVYLMTREAYQAVSDKDAEGLVSQLYIEKVTTATIGTREYLGRLIIYPIPVPDRSTDVFHYTRIRRLEDFDAASDDPDFPVKWIRALKYGLAAELAPEYGLPLPERAWLQAQAEKAKDAARKDDVEPGGFRVMPDLTPYGGW